jgi:hypothetical protein
VSARYAFTCNRCDFSLTAWSCGNPYIEYPPGTRQHFHHPGEGQKIADIAKSILGREPTEDDCDSILRNYSGNEPNHVCKECLTISKLDLLKDVLACRQCGAATVERILDLAGKQCLRCKGVFSRTLDAMS